MRRLEIAWMVILIVDAGALAVRAPFGAVGWPFRAG